MNAEQEMTWATPEEAAEVQWIITRPAYLILLFVAGWAIDVKVFTRFRIDYASALGLDPDELISAQRLCYMALIAGFVLTVTSNVCFRQAPSPLVFLCLLLFYPAAFAAIFSCTRSKLARYARWQVPFFRALKRCMFPIDSKEIPFVEVLIADDLTSLAKVFFDLAFGSCVVFRSWDLGIYQSPGGLLMHQVIRQGGKATQMEHTLAHHKSTLGQALDECSGSSIPFFLWACPFLIRARQCIITSHHAPDSVSRDLQRVNLAKYLTSLPVVFCAYMYAQSRHDTPVLPGAVMKQEEVEAWWAFASLVNTVFSSFWDLVMDWGLLQPSPWRKFHWWSFGLRPVLLFRSVWGFYHIAVICNLGGRTLWTLRWSPELSQFLGTLFLTTLQQAAEVIRRCLWNILRVEWECIRKGVHRSDAHFPI